MLFRFWSGTRPSEAIGLRWRAVDLPRRRLRVLASRVLGRDGRPRTGKSKRDVPLHQEVVEFLERIRPAEVEPDTFVFTTPSGTPFDETNFSTRMWVPALRAAKVRVRPFYNTRHTYISWLLDHGARPLFVCRRTGASLEMIERHYGNARVTPDQLDRLGHLEQSTSAPRRPAPRRTINQWDARELIQSMTLACSRPSRPALCRQTFPPPDSGTFGMPGTPPRHQLPYKLPEIGGRCAPYLCHVGAR